MTFITSALSSPQLSAIRANGYSARQYVLFAPNTVVFQARVNQATFTDSFVSVDYDTVTTGAHTAIREGFTVYIGATSDIREATFIGYARRDNAGIVASATSININQTSAVIGDNWYITITKDVRLWYKVPRYISSSSYFKDWSITFRRVRPLVTGIQTAYVKVLSSGVADFAFTPSASAVDADATSSFTWSWDADGGTFQSGTSSSKNVTLRYSSAGHYMPRVTVTDSNGVSNWLTCHVFVVPADYSSVVEARAEGAQIDCSLDGNNAEISFFDGVDTLPDYTFCAVWCPNNLTTTYTSDILFVGRLRNEQIEANRDPIALYTPRTAFQIEGISTELSRLSNAGSATLKNVASPAKFDEIKNLTPLRGLGYYLSEHTTLTNIASLALDDLTNTYLMWTYGLDQTSVLEQCNVLLEATNRVFEYARTGEIATVRKAVYMTSAERNALTTIMQMTTADMMVGGGGGMMYNVSADMVNTVGRMSASGGSYNETTGQYQVYKALAPAVIPTDGDDSGSLPEQILTANALSGAELGERCANAFAEAQPPTILTVNLRPAYAGLIPSVNKWYTFDISSTTNNRGVTYTSSERWLLIAVSVQHDNETGFPTVSATFQRETVGGDYQTTVFTPDDATEYTNPIMPLDSVYPNLPGNSSILYPDPANIDPDDLPPFNNKDVADKTKPTQPGTNQDTLETGLAGMAWNATSVYYVTNLGSIASFADVTPSTLETYAIRDAQLSRTDNKAYIVASDGSAQSRFFRTNAFGSVDYAKTDIEGDYRRVRPTTSSGGVYVLSNAVPGWTEVFDFTQEEYADYWNITPFDIQTPVWTDGVGYENGIVTSSSFRFNAVQLVTEIFTDTYVTSVGVYYTIVAPTSIGSLAATSIQYRTGLNGALSGIFSVDIPNTAHSSSIAFLVNLTRDYILVQVNGARNLAPTSPNGNVIITRIDISGTGINPFTAGNFYNSRYSTNDGSTFSDPESLETSPSANGGFDTQIGGDTVFVSGNAKVYKATGGGSYSDASGGTTTGTYAQCIVSYGTGANFLMATPASVSGESVWKVVGGSATAITPNDGANDGLSVSQNCIAVADGIESHIVAVLSFGGVRKVAYSINNGSTWAFNTQVSNSANYARMIRIGTLFYIAICDGGTIWWGTWDGVGAFTLYPRVAPISVGGFEFR